MEESTGELNNSIVVVLAVGVLIAFFYYTIWPIIKESFDKTSRCSKAICEPCKNANHKCEFVSCYLKENPSDIFECVYKG